MYTINNETLENDFKQIKLKLKQLPNAWLAEEYNADTIGHMKARMRSLESIGRDLESIYNKIKKDAKENKIELRNHPAFQDYKNITKLFRKIEDAKSTCSYEYACYLKHLYLVAKESNDLFAKPVNLVFGKFSFSPKVKGEKAKEILTTELTELSTDLHESKHTLMFSNNNECLKILNKCNRVLNLQIPYLEVSSTTIKK